MKRAIDLVRWARPCSSRASKYRGFTPAQAWAKIQVDVSYGNIAKDRDLRWLMAAVSHYDNDGDGMMFCHEAEIERLTKERDEARNLKIAEVMGATKKVCDERDSALARAEAAEAKALTLSDEIEMRRREVAQCAALAEGWRKSHGIQYRRAHAAEARALTLDAENTRLEVALQEAGATLDDEQAAHAETLALNTRQEKELGLWNALRESEAPCTLTGGDCTKVATCVGVADGEAYFGCDEHCGHGGEDQSCEPFVRPESDNGTIRQPATLEAEIERLRGEVLRLGKELNEGDQILALEQQLSEARAAASRAHEVIGFLDHLLNSPSHLIAGCHTCSRGDPRNAPIPAQPSPPAASALVVCDFDAIEHDPNQCNVDGCTNPRPAPRADSEPAGRCADVASDEAGYFVCGNPLPCSAHPVGGGK